MNKFQHRIKQYARRFSEKRLFQNLKRFARRLGAKAVYTILLLFYAFQRKDTPQWAKNIVLGALGYFLTPIDGLPDFTPVIGYTDDIGVLSFGLVTIAAYVDEEVRKKARLRLQGWFGPVEEAVLAEVDEKL